MDQEENCDLFLGNSRRDRKTKREENLTKLDDAIFQFSWVIPPPSDGIEYTWQYKTLNQLVVSPCADAMLDRNRNTFAFGEPKEERHYKSS